MNESARVELIRTSWELHSVIEDAYLKNPAAKGDNEWLEKQRFLLADMAIHLLQTAIKPGDIEIDRLKNNLYSVIKISDQFITNPVLKEVVETIFD